MRSPNLISSRRVSGVIWSPSLAISSNSESDRLVSSSLFASLVLPLLSLLFSPSLFSAVFTCSSPRACCHFLASPLSRSSPRFFYRPFVDFLRISTSHEYRAERLFPLPFERSDGRHALLQNGKPQASPHLRKSTEDSFVLQNANNRACEL